jgi:peptidoglycan/xylan/chitin deacetylase (PgdA/CDA1 family)
VNLLHSQRVFTYVSQHLVCSVPMRQRRVAFTFDDGPNPQATPRLLDVLARHDVQATFFLVGRNVARHPHLAAEIAARGHEIGNHTQNHMLMPVLPLGVMLREMERASRAIHAATGQRPHLFRPPMGWFSRTMLRSLGERGYRPVLGDVYPQDCTRPGRDVIVQRVLERIGPGSIVILHDGVVHGAADRLQSVEAVEVLLDELRARQYSFGTVSQLLEAGEREPAADESELPAVRSDCA